MKKPRPITSMQSLNSEQLLQVTVWLEDGLAFDKVSEMIEQEFHVHVSATSLHRFYQRHQARVLTESRAELTEDARSWVNYAAQGEVDFSAAALEAIRQKVFELAISNTDPEQLKALFTILFASQHAEVRKQNAETSAKRTQIAAKRLALQEQKFRLILQKDGLIPFDDPAYQKEKSPELVEFLDRCHQEGYPQTEAARRRIYQEVFRKRKSPPTIPAPTVNPVPTPMPGAKKKTFSGLDQIIDLFRPSIPEPQPVEQSPSTATGEPTPSCPEATVDLIETNNSEPQPVEPSTLPTPEDSAVANSDPAPKPTDPIISETPAVEPPSLPTPEEPTTQCEETPVQTQSESDSNADEESSDPDSKPHPRPNAPTLGERIHAYVHARRLEEIELRRTHPNSYYWTRYNCCPCGLKLPCPDHGHLPPDIASNTPDTCGFNDAMEKRFRTLKLDRILSRYTPYEYSEQRPGTLDIIEPSATFGHP